MTISPWLIYLWGIADQIRTTSIILMILLVFASFVFLLVWGFCMDEGDEEGATSWMKRVQKVGFMAILSAILAAFLPSSKTIAVMVVLPAIVNSEPIQKDLPDLYRIAVDALKDQLVPEKTK